LQEKENSKIGAEVVQLEIKSPKLSKELTRKSTRLDEFKKKIDEMKKT